MFYGLFTLREEGRDASRMDLVSRASLPQLPPCQLLWESQKRPRVGAWGREGVCALSELLRA